LAALQDEFTAGGLAGQPAARAVQFQCSIVETGSPCEQVHDSPAVFPLAG